MIECLYLIGILAVASPATAAILYATLLWPLNYLWRWFTAHDVPDWLQLAVTFAILGIYVGVIACILHTVVGE